MKESVQEITERLKSVGGRNTPLRRAILECLLEFDSPMPAVHLTKALNAKGFSPNKTTVYRQLSTLLENKAIEMFRLDNGTQFFEIAKPHHHHFVCDKCSRVIDVNSPDVESALHTFEKELAKKNIRVSKHEFALYGLCEKCN